MTLNTVQILVVILAFIGVMLTGTFLYWGLRSRSEAEDRELARRLGTLSNDREETLFRLNARDPLADALGAIGDGLDDLIRQAGSPYELSGLFVRMSVWAIAGTLILGVLTKGPAALIGGALGLIPLALLKSTADARARLLTEQLPDALDLVGRSLQAGHGLSDAMRLCAEEMSVPVSQEFGRVYEENNLGRDMRESLNGLSQRNPRNFDLRIFVSSVLLQRDTGGNLIEILDNISSTIRERAVFKKKVSALTAEARISALILGSLPFVLAILILVVQPAYLAPLLTDSWGHMLLFGAGSLFFVGVFVMIKLCEIEV